MSKSPKTTTPKRSKTTPAKPRTPPLLSPDRRLAIAYLQRLMDQANSALPFPDDIHDDEDVELLLGIARAHSIAEDKRSSIFVRRTFAVDAGLYAVLLAKAIAAIPGLSGDLADAKAQTIIIQADSIDAINALKAVVKTCVLPTKTDYMSKAPSIPERPSAFVMTVDGSDLGRGSRRSYSQDATDAIRRGACVICITDVPHEVPAIVQRFAAHTIRLPKPDGWTIRALSNLRFQDRPTVPCPDEVANDVDPIALSVAWRNVDTADAAITSLIEAHAMKATKPVTTGPRLSELEGYGEAKVWGMELAADLQLMRSGKLVWADVDHKGLLLSGRPGTGKTTFAMALANEAGVPLIATSVADWTRADHLGITQQKMKRAFTDAIAKAPSILFIDELDGIADRGTLRGHNAEYWTHVVNSLLELLAGVEGRDGVVVVGASNFPDKIDAAVRRSGRLDRHIRIPLPDLPALTQILRYHLRGDLNGVDLRSFVTSLIGFSGADLEALVRRARGRARRAGRALLVEDLNALQHDSVHAKDPVILRKVAIHESGHALAARLVNRPVECMAMTSNGGVAMIETSLDGTATVADFENSIMLGLAGRAAEEVVYGVNSSTVGAESDLEKATALALMIETRLGAGILGPLHLGHADPHLLLAMPEIRHATSKRLSECHDRALALLRDNEAALMALATALGTEGYLDSARIDAVIAQGKVTTTPKPVTRQTKGAPNVT